MENKRMSLWKQSKPYLCLLYTSAPPFKEAFVEIMYGEGISKTGELLKIASDLDIIKKACLLYTSRTKVSEGLIDQHYQDLVGQSFYPPIREFMTSGPVLVGIISGPKVIETWRTMMGATRPEEALPGTIRGDFAKAAGENEVIQNVVHGSDSEESAKREIALWFEEK